MTIKLRGASDSLRALEPIIYAGLCPADLWTLPTYTDLLFLDQTTNVDKNYFP